MLALGIILLLVAAAAVVGVVAEGSSQDVAFTSTVGDLTTQPVWIFLAGVLATLLALLGAWFIRRGTSRRVARRRELKRLRRVEQENAAQEAAEREAAEREAAEREAAGTPSDRAGTEDREVPDRRLVREDVGRRRDTAEATAPAAQVEPDAAAPVDHSRTAGTSAPPPSDAERGPLGAEQDGPAHRQP